MTRPVWSWAGVGVVVVVLAGCGATSDDPGPGAELEAGSGGTAASLGGNQGTSGAGAGMSELAGGAHDDVPASTAGNLLGTGELGVCNAQSWCWQTPAPAGELFSALSDDGRYAAGENGIVFQWPDRYLPPAGTALLSHVQTAGNTLWAGGFGLWRYDGADWIQEFMDPVFALSPAPSGELWALVGGLVRHHRDGEWALEQPAAVQERDLMLLDLMAVDDDTVWALATSFESPKGPTGELTLFELSAGVWSERPSGVKDSGNSWTFLRVGAMIYVYSRTAAGDVYSPADDWSLVMKQPTSASYGLFASPDGGFLSSGITGLYTVTSQGAERISETACRALVPTRDGQALCALGFGGLSLIRPVAMPASSAPDESPKQLDAELFGRVPTPIWARAYVAWGSAPTDVWRAPFERFDGVKWTSYAAPSNFAVGVIHGSAPDNVWFAGDREILHYDGTALHEVPLPEVTGTQPHFVSTVYTLGANDTWVVRGTPDAVKLLHFDGVEWNDTLSIDGGSFAYSRAQFAGGGAQPLWAAVGHGLYRRDGDAWKLVLSHDGYSLVDLAIDGTDMWALGQDAVYQVVDGELVARGAQSGGLQYIALTESHVWHFQGTHARTLLRSSVMK